MSADLSRSDREMLKAIYRATIGRGGAVDPAVAHTGDLADAMSTSPSTATAHIKRLADRGMVQHTRYIGVTLTEAGRVAAVAAIRRHRVVERFLVDHLGYQWTEVDRLAVRFEHELPEDLERRLHRVLGQPDTCPHGFPIPVTHDLDPAPLPSLYDLEPGDVAVLAVPGSTAPDVIEFLDTLGVRPGTRIEVREKHPFDGPVVLRVGAEVRTLGRRVAEQLFVQALGGPGPPDHPEEP